MLSQIHRRNTDLMAAIRREAKKARVKELRGRVLNRIVDRALEGGPLTSMSAMSAPLRLSTETGRR